MILELTELWTAVYVSNLARIGAKICENAFRTIPEILFFDAKKFFSRNFWIENFIFANFARFRTSQGRTDVAISSCIKFCSRLANSKVCATKKRVWPGPARPGPTRPDPSRPENKQYHLRKNIHIHRQMDVKLNELAKQILMLLPLLLLLLLLMYVLCHVLTRVPSCNARKR